MELSISQFLHNLGLEHLLEIFDREQVIAKVSMFIIVLSIASPTLSLSQDRVHDKTETLSFRVGVRLQHWQSYFET